MAMKSLCILCCLTLTGCSTALHTRSDLYHQGYLPQELGMFYYTGSTDSLHHFHKTRFLRLDKRFTLPKSEFEFRSEFQWTADRPQWLYLTFADGLSFHGDRDDGGLGVVETIDFDTNGEPNQTAERTGAPRLNSDAQ